MLLNTFLFLVHQIYQQINITLTCNRKEICRLNFAFIAEIKRLKSSKKLILCQKSLQVLSTLLAKSLRASITDKNRVIFFLGSPLNSIFSSFSGSKPTYHCRHRIVALYLSKKSILTIMLKSCISSIMKSPSNTL